MKAATLKILCLLVLAALLLPVAIACKPSSDDPGTPGGTPGEEEIAFAPVLRFLVTSDLHLRTTANDYQSYETLQKLYRTAYAYSEAQDYSKLDGIFFAGDFTQNGSTAEMTKFFDFVNQNTKKGTTVRAILGNHEYWASGSQYREEEGTRYGPKSIAATYQKYTSLGGYETVDAHLIISGYHFLILNMDRYNDDYTGSKFSPAKLAWLETELAAAAADDPTGKKPIFVFQHMPATATVNNSSQSSSDDNLEKIFNKYPQAVDFSGHTHRPITDPRSIWQKGYTAINTASLAYLGVNIANHPTYDKKAVVAMDNEGNWEYGDIETAVRNAVLYYFVEVNAENEIRLVVYNLLTESVLKTIYIGGVGDPSTFTYTNTRKQISEAPKFPDGAKLEVVSTTFGGARLSIPQAFCTDTVNNYRCEVIGPNGNWVKIYYRLAVQYLGNAAPKSIPLSIKALDPGKTYTVKVIPVSTWGKEGEPLVTSLTTKSISDTPVPDLFSIAFNADGSAVNTLTGQKLAVTGKPTVEKNSTLNQYVGVFNGSSAYRFEDMPGLYGTISTGFSFEAYVYLNGLPSGRLVNPASNQEGGGFGFEHQKDGKMYFYCHDGSGYLNPGLDMPTGQWVHLVGVFDGSSVTLYVNGTSASVPSGETMKSPSSSAQYLCIGGDSDSGTGSSFMKGKIAAVNLYSYPLPAAAVANLYNQYK